MKKSPIPPISDEELIRRYLRIKPILQYNGKQYWFRNYSIKELREHTHFWSAITEKNEPVGESLSNHTSFDLSCRHSCGRHGLFCPSVAEILAQIPQEISDGYNIEAFEILGDPCSLDAAEYGKARRLGYHVSVVRFYIRVSTT